METRPLTIQYLKMTIASLRNVRECEKLEWTDEHWMIHKRRPADLTSTEFNENIIKISMCSCYSSSLACMHWLSRIPDPGSKRFQIPDPGPHKNFLKYFNPKNCFWALENMTRLFILDPDPDFLPIQDTESRGQKGTRSRICNTACMFMETIVADPDPPDPHVFGPPGSGSISQRFGFGSISGSFYH